MSPLKGGVVIDLRATQSPDHRGRGIGRYAVELALALERRGDDLVGRYLLEPAWPPPASAELGPLVTSGKIAYAGAAGAIPESTRLYHCMSPFELSVPCPRLWPPEVELNGLFFSTMVFDLIPLRMPGDYLADARQERRYRSHLELLRLADGVLAISEATRRDAIELAGLEAARVSSIGTGTPDDMVPPASRLVAAGRALTAVPGLSPPFVLYPAGSDGRKNVERLIRAFALLPDQVRTAHQLVIACELPRPMANHFRILADDLGIKAQLLLTGHVPRSALGLMYQG
ncbi:MAG: hypothetical protein ACRDZ5_05735, partial [Acidimicrobiales bacterium]